MDSVWFRRKHALEDLSEAREAYLRDGRAPATVRPVVLDSWERSRAYGIHPRRLDGQMIEHDSLRAARQRSALLMVAAEPFLELVHRTLAAELHVVALSDGDGRILRLLASPGFEDRDLRASNLIEGASWHERDIGCNGVGTCLETGEPVILIGPEHFQEHYVGWTCIGAPIRHPSGAIVGALDLSVPNEYTHVHSWGWTLTVARGIETALARYAAPDETALERAAADAERPLRSVAATFDLLATKIDSSPTHKRFLEEARAELEDAERQRDVRIRQLSAALRDRSRAEQASAHDREFLQRLIDSIPVMVTVFDPALQKVAVNPHLTKVTGWTDADLHGGGMLESCYPDPEYRERVRRFMEVPGPAWLDIEMTAKDGSKVPTTWANIRLTDDRLVGIGVDLTDRAKTRQELQDAYEAARRALREHDHVLALVSHDLRTPLHTLRMAGSLLLEDFPEEKRQAQVAIIRRSVDYMTRLIEDLLDAARIEGGGLRVEPTPLRAAKLVRAALDQMTPLAEADSVSLRAGEIPARRVHADPTRIAQVFSNIIGNAIHHTPADGSVVLSAVEAGPGEVRFSIRDTGSGIASKDLPHVFARYWQARGTDSAGAGLGLAIAKGIVEAHGGRIWVESEEDVGAAFHFTLPASGD